MGRPQKYFNAENMAIVDHAVAVAEDVISNHYQLTFSSWGKYRYDIRTLRNLNSAEIVSEAFAQIIRLGRPDWPSGMRVGDLYRICLQDQNILRALRRDPSLQLLPLLTYVVTHELIHVVRFYKFHQFFLANDEERETEESRVHQLTYTLLRPVGIKDMPVIFEFYENHRQPDAMN
jgi:hypothetical protein